MKPFRNLSMLTLILLISLGVNAQSYKLNNGRQIEFPRSFLIKEGTGVTPTLAQYGVIGLFGKNLKQCAEEPISIHTQLIGKNFLNRLLSD